MLDAPLLEGNLDNLQEMVLILNKERQIVFANFRVAEFLGLDDVTELYGLRLGEALGCVYALAEETPAGCGTSRFCRTCGAVNAVFNSQQNGTDEQEFSITREGNPGALNLRVRTTDLEVEDEDFTLFTMEDITGEKRHRELERTLYHDIANTADVLARLTKELEVAPPEKQSEVRQGIASAAQHLIDEVASHKILAMAEHGELVCVPEAVSTAEILQEMVSLFDGHPSAEGRQLTLGKRKVDCRVETDRGLLSRVIVNMLKNAFEATPPGGIVTLGCDREGESFRFWVHNAAVMPYDVALQVFRRSFSTKGEGRGLGTYSMRLLGERYLKGQVSFVSEGGCGTTFSAVFPLRFGR